MERREEGGEGRREVEEKGEGAGDGRVGEAIQGKEK